MTFLRPFSLIALFLSGYAAEPDPDAPSIEPSIPNPIEFIRMSCGATRYPNTCFQSLSGYAAAVQLDPARLASVAVGLSLSRAALMPIFLSNLTHGAEASDPRCGSALRDCVALFRDAVSQMRGSLRQMRQLNGGREELGFQLSNVQTWMSAALTNEETCTDGFEGVADGAVKTDVCDRAANVKEVTSNALALVNSLADEVIAP